MKEETKQQYKDAIEKAFEDVQHLPEEEQMDKFGELLKEYIKELPSE